MDCTTRQQDADSPTHAKEDVEAGMTSLRISPHDGALHVDERLLCVAGLGVHDIGAVVSLQPPRRAGTGIVCAVDAPHRWSSYAVTSLALHFTAGRCRGATVTLAPHAADLGRQAQELMIAACLRAALPDVERHASASELAFTAPWGRVACILSGETGAVTVQVHYAAVPRG